MTFSAPQISDKLQVMRAESAAYPFARLQCGAGSEYTALRIGIDFEAKIREREGVLLWLTGLTQRHSIRRSALGKILGAIKFLMWNRR